MKLTIIGVVLSIVLVGCSSGGAASTPSDSAGVSSNPSCDDWSAAPVTDAVIAKGCRDGSTILMTATNKCSDGRTIFWNDSGWGYIGSPMTMHPSGMQGPHTPSPAEYSKCLGF